MKQTKKRRAPRKNARKQSMPQPLSPSLIGKSVLYSICIGLGLLLLASLCAYFLKDPTAWISPLAWTASAITAFLGGTVAVRLHGHSALLCGLCNGAALLVLMIPFSILLHSYASTYAAWIAWMMHALFLLLSIAGAYLGLPKPPRAKRKR